MEKRNHARRPLQLYGHFTTSGLQDVACELSDFCRSGMYLQFRNLNEKRIAKPSRPKRNEQVKIEFKANQGHSYQVRAKIMRITHDAMGVAFEAISEEALFALNKAADEYARSASAKSNVTTVLDKASRVEVAKQLRSVLLQHLTPLLDVVFTKMDEALLDAANQAANDTKQRNYFDFKNQLRANSNSIKGKFLFAIRDQVDQQVLNGIGTAQHQVLTQITPGELSLVENKELEEWLITKVIVSKAESKYRESLAGLRPRIEQLTGNAAAANEYLCGPEFICRIFQESMPAINAQNEIEKILYRCYEKELVMQLATMYAKLDAVLVAADILPDLDIKQLLRGSSPERPVRDARDGAAARVADNASDGVPQAGQVSAVNSTSGQVGSPAAVASASSGGQASGSANQVNGVVAERVDLGADSASEAGGGYVQQSTQPGAGGGVSNPPDFGDQPSISALRAGESIGFTLPSSSSVESVLRALGSVQQQTAQIGANVEEDLKRSVAKAIVSEQGQSAWQGVEQEVTRSLDRVTQLFKHFSSYESSVEKIQPWLNKLKLPLSRVLLQDKSFLVDKQHPARQLLDQMANFALKGGPTNKEQQTTIEHFVDEVLQSEDVNAGVFESALNQLDPIVARQEQVFERNVERVVKASEGQEKVDSARRIVTSELNERLAGNTVPLLLLNLLGAGWRNLLSLSIIRYGVDSEQWHNSLALFEDLLTRFEQYLAIKATDANSNRDFLAELRATLTSSSAGSVQMESLLTDIDSILAPNLDAEVPTLEVIEVPQAGIDAIEDDRVQVRSTQHRVENVSVPDDEQAMKWSKRVKRMRLGDWVLGNDEHGEESYIQLAWENQEKSRFVFVNQRGVKAGDFTLAELIEQLVAGQIELRYDDAPPMVDEGLHKMVQQIYEEVINRGASDAVAGLAGRQYLEQVLQRAFVNAKSGKAQHVVAYMSLQRFKLINTKCGFAAGDQVLKDVGEILQSKMGKAAVVAHVGGEEFCVLQRNTTAERVYAQASRAIEEIEKYRLHFKDQPYTVGMNVGLMCIDQNSRSVQGILDAAANACAVLQRSGENKIKVYQQDDDEVAKHDERSSWMLQINKILENNLLQLRCQRIHPIGVNEALPHYEVLLSMLDDDGKVLPPTELIIAAERYNRMLEIDQWVIRNAFQWMVENRKVLDELSGLSINLSGQSVGDESLLEYIFEQFAITGAPRDKVCFEVTETEAISSIHDAADFVYEMKQLGCKFSLDDFGAGLSSYAYLKHLPVDYLKIDGSLVKDIITAPYDYAMVKSICEVGHFMGKKVVAEYVENDEILKVLVEIGVDYAQGYGIEKPIPLIKLSERREIETA